MIKFIYFDIGGTLLYYSKVFQTAASKFNLTVDDIGDVFDENHDDITKGVMSAKDFWDKCIKKYDLKNASDYDFLDSWVSDYEPILETHDLIKRIFPKYKIGILSNIYRGMRPLLLKKGDIPNIKYDQIIFSCDVGMMKPNADIYELAQKRAGAEAKEILLIDDREDYCDGARKAGWNTFLFNPKESKASAEESEKYLNNFGK